VAFLRDSRFVFHLLVAFGLGFAAPASGEILTFDNSWKEQGFLRFWSNKYEQLGAQLQVTSDGTVSLLYRRVPQAAWGSLNASWQWSVSETVVATDLTVKSGDDRNLAMYFVFVDQASAEKLAKKPARRLLRNKNVRSLVYVWGGDYAPGTVLFSPYGPDTLKTIISRPAGTGEFSEIVDLAADFKRAFGQEPGVLVGVGITADSDDTDGKISAIVRDLKVF